MADEIKIRTELSCDNGFFHFPSQGVNTYYDQTTPGGGGPGSKTIATGGTTISFADMTAPGWCYMQNLDVSNYVTYGGSSDQPFMMKPGEPALVRINPSGTLRLVANSAACEVLIQVLED